MKSPFNTMAGIIPALLHLIPAAGILFLIYKIYSSVKGTEYKTPGTFDAKAVADQQLWSMANPGTDYQTLKKTIENLTPKQLDQVFDAFGYQKYWLNGLMRLWGKPLNLFQWYAEELDTLQAAEIREIWKKGTNPPTF